MLQALQPMLGEAVSPAQLVVTLSSCLGFFTMRYLVSENAPAVKSSGEILTAKERRELGASVCGLVHAVAVSIVALWILLWPEADIALGPSALYGRSERSQTLFAVSTGYFMWDLITVLSNFHTYGFPFLLHAVACFGCYLMGQYPFLNYYGAAFLLFELSTPFLQARHIFLLLGLKSHPVFPHIESAFGVAFIGCRILFGYPLSYMFIQDMRVLLASGKAHSNAVVYYNLAANVGLCALNAFWLSLMIMKGFRKRREARKRKEA
jgi:hypothetical protein